MKCNSKGKIDKRVLDAVLEATRAELMKEILAEENLKDLIRLVRLKKVKWTKKWYKKFEKNHSSC